MTCCLIILYWYIDLKLVVFMVPNPNRTHIFYTCTSCVHEITLVPLYFVVMQHGIYSEYVCMDSQVLRSGSWNSTPTILSVRSGCQEVLWKHFLVNTSIAVEAS